MLKKNIRRIFYLLVVLGSFRAIAGSYEDYFRAIENNNHRAVAALLARGFDPNTRDEHGQVGLFLAFRGGALDIAEVLVSHPQLQVDATNTLGETPLMMAALRGHLEWCRRMLDLGAKLERKGWTPLHYAATGPDSRVVELLLNRGAAIDALAPDRSTPLMMAAIYGSEASVELLLSRGAATGLRNERGQRAVDLARGVGRDALAARLERATR
jgi:ankyrin repeat protein